MGTAPRWPGEAAASHRGGCLRGGARPAAAAAGAVGRPLLQVTLSFHWHFQPLSSTSQGNACLLQMNFFYTLATFV